MNQRKWIAEPSADDVCYCGHARWRHLGKAPKCRGACGQCDAEKSVSASRCKRFKLSPTGKAIGGRR